MMVAKNTRQSGWNDWLLFFNHVLKGTGQIMLQENAITGFLFLVGIAIGSINMVLAAILAVCIATLSAIAFKYDKENIDKGLYGFNAALVGVALLLFLKPITITWFLVIIGAVFSTIIAHFFIRRNLIVFTLPFVLITWVIIYSIKFFYPALIADTPESVIQYENDFGFAIRGYGQVIFQENILSGAIFFIAVFISSPVAALYGLAGAIAAVFISIPFSVTPENIQAGLVSYNSVLCAIAFAGTKIKDGVWVLLSVVLACIAGLILKDNIIQLTFPFVAASVFILKIKNRLSQLSAD
ncbi:MAG: urea transporter [Bacteroidetes bacterium]|nr:urea transporter [Bacteroidota bacterium]